MAEESPSGGEKTEEPTGKRRDDFRKKGTVAQSKEVHTAALLTGLILFWIFYMPTFWEGLINLITTLLQTLDDFVITPASTVQLSYFIIQQMGILLIPIFAVVAIIGILSSYFQIGWLLTGKPLKPDLGKLNPIQGAKKFISKKSFVDLVKSIAKIAFIGWLAYGTIFDNFEKALQLADMTAAIAILFLAKTATVIIAKICAAMIVIAFIDFLFQRYEMEEKMKMTKQEVKEEYKESEGDPLIKAQIRAIQREMARKRMMAEVPEADVIITNPTHISIAVKYNSSDMDAPIVVAKGTDIVAMKIREIAREHEVPIVENPPVARLLHKLDIGTQVPEEMFKAVAEILAHVYKLKNKSL